MIQSHLISIIGLAVSTVCIGAYIYGCVLRPRAYRSLGVLGFFATIVALAQLSLSFSAPDQWQVNARYAFVFLAIAGLAQAVAALRGRRASEEREASA
jgi:hypothetical protein